MKVFDQEDRQVIRSLSGVVLFFIGALAVVAVAGAGIIGLAMRVFGLAAG